MVADEETGNAWPLQRYLRIPGILMILFGIEIIVIALGMCFLCGIFVPLEFLGDSIIKAAHFLPAYWYITSASWIDRYVPGQAMGELWRGMGIQLLFGAALFGVGLAYSREKVAAGQGE